jgi:hypothetical protein
MGFAAGSLKPILTIKPPCYEHFPRHAKALPRLCCAHWQDLLGGCLLQWCLQSTLRFRLPRKEVSRFAVLIRNDLHSRLFRKSEFVGMMGTAWAQQSLPFRSPCNILDISAVAIGKWSLFQYVLQAAAWAFDKEACSRHEGSASSITVSWTTTVQWHWMFTSASASLPTSPFLEIQNRAEMLAGFAQQLPQFWWRTERTKRGRGRPQIVRW